MAIGTHETLIERNGLQYDGIARPTQSKTQNTVVMMIGDHDAIFPASALSMYPGNNESVMQKFKKTVHVLYALC